MTTFAESAWGVLGTDYHLALPSEPPTELCVLMCSEGSDKATGWHNYAKFYDAIFRALRWTSFSFFELGLGSADPSIQSTHPDQKPGASLRAWARYFPNAAIFGADVDPLIVGGPHDSDRIQTAWVDQTNPVAIQSLWETFPREFDIMIEDGLHEAHANMTFLEHSHHKLSATGVYVIEDIHRDEADYLMGRLQEFGASHGFMGRMIELPSEYKDPDGINWGPADNILAFLIRAGAV